MSGDEPFLSRWSKRKIEARSAPAPAPAPAPSDTPLETPSVPAVSQAVPTPVAEDPTPASAPELPSIESLTPESDIRAFMHPGVAPHLKNQALRNLFRDPHFNVMDGLDTYIADYSLPDPLPDSWLAQMNQMSHLGDVAKVLEEAPEAENPESSVQIASQDVALEIEQEQCLGNTAVADSSLTVDAPVKVPPGRE